MFRSHAYGIICRKKRYYFYFLLYIQVEVQIVTRPNYKYIFCGCLLCVCYILLTSLSHAHCTFFKCCCTKGPAFCVGKRGASVLYSRGIGIGCNGMIPSGQKRALSKWFACQIDDSLLIVCWFFPVSGPCSFYFYLVFFFNFFFFTTIKLIWCEPCVAVYFICISIIDLSICHVKYENAFSFNEMHKSLCFLYDVLQLTFDLQVKLHIWIAVVEKKNRAPADWHLINLFKTYISRMHNLPIFHFPGTIKM